MQSITVLATRILEACKNEFDMTEHPFALDSSKKIPFLLKYNVQFPNINQIREIRDSPDGGSSSTSSSFIEVETYLSIAKKRSNFVPSGLSTITYDIYFRMISPHIMLHACEDEGEEFSYILFPNYYLISDALVLDHSIVMSSLLSFQQILPLLSFHKYLGHIYLPNHPHMLSYYTFGMTYSHKNICCVCSEPCLLTTNCRHSLCVWCWSKLQQNSCPMCRRADLYVSYEMIPDYEHSGCWEQDYLKLFPPVVVNP